MGENTVMGQQRSEISNPRSEIRDPKEARDPKPGFQFVALLALGTIPGVTLPAIPAADAILRISVFGFLSDLGFLGFRNSPSVSDFLFAFPAGIKDLSSMNTRPLLLLVGCLVLFGAPALRAHPHPPTDEMAQAANNFLAALTSEQKAKATFALKDEERFNWHFVPKDRNGLSFKEMTPTQRQLAHALLGSGMSHRGHLKALTIMSLEQVLQDLEGPNRRFSRDPDLYFVAIFGQPGPKATWAWRVEGHHLAINFTIVKGKHVSATPTFFGANPAEVKEGPRKGLRVLAAEEDLARQLVKSFSDAERKTAIINVKAPADIITGAQRKVKPLELVGMPAEKMTKDQQQLLETLIREYVYRHRSEIADEDMRKIQEAGFGRIHFAWAGGIEPGEGHYYRIQGPTFLMEYDNVQNDNNHIHCVWRDFENDFGEDLLRKHYDEHHR
jgi:hypothetical protein